MPITAHDNAQLRVWIDAELKKTSVDVAAKVQEIAQEPIRYSTDHQEMIADVHMNLRARAFALGKIHA